MKTARGARVLLLASALALGGCAAARGPAASAADDAEPSRAAAAPNPVDPWEPMNRAIFRFNDAVDSAFLKPVAHAYVDYVPDVLRFVVGNFFSNLRDLWTSANQLMQGKPSLAASDLSRFVINTTFGFVGFGDVASDMGIERHNEDFGQTLGVWGFRQGPYLVLPFFGPSTVRDTGGFAVDWVTDPVMAIPSHGERNNAFAVRTVDRRAALFPAERVIEGAVLDKYSFIRDAYLQRRRNLVYDGNPPPEHDDYGPGGNGGDAPPTK